MSDTCSDSDSDCEIVAPSAPPNAATTSSSSSIDADVRMELNAMMGVGAEPPVVVQRSSAVMSRLGGSPKMAQSELRSLGKGSPITPKLSAPKPKAVDLAAKNEFESIMRKSAMSSEERLVFVELC